MAEVAGSLITELLRRVRDPQGDAHSRADVLVMLDRCQKMVNVFTRKTYSADAVTTTPTQQFYSTLELAPSAVNVMDIKEGNRSLPKVPWHTLFYTNREWTREVASRHEVFAQLGIDLLVVHPSTALAGSITVVAVKDTTTLADEDTATDLVDDDLPAVLDLLEGLVLLRHREFSGSQEALQRLVPRAVMDRRK